MESDRLLTAADVAELLSVPVSWVREHTRSGRIPHGQLGHYVRYRHGDNDLVRAARQHDFLRQARAHLVQGSPDKGGHRANAIRLVNQAIDEVQEGIRWDRRH